MPSREELKMLQSLPLEVKIRKTEQRIKEWYEFFGGQVYISFSGGKDSTVLLDIVRKLYPDVEAVFVDTGLEYPEIRQFVKSFENITWLKPKMTFKEVCLKYGFPFISKEISGKIFMARKNIESGKDTLRVRQLNGIEKDKDGNKSRYNCEKYGFALNSPFLIGDHCCEVMKKTPTKLFEKNTGKKPILGMMAHESSKREQDYLKTGCNAFDKKRSQSQPIGFWTEQDVLQYIKQNNIQICSVYGDIVYTDDDGMQYDNDIFNCGMKLKTTGCNRTGCMFCGYGCHLEKPGEGRFEMMKETHPKQYEYIVKPEEEGGLGYKDKIDWLNENGSLHIKY